jgi:hypothetical protein
VTLAVVTIGADELRELIRSEVEAALRASSRGAGVAASTTKRTLTINDMRKRYGAGRATLLDMIISGRLPAVEQVMRGGHRGWRVRVEDAERVLAGAA